MGNLLVRFDEDLGGWRFGHLPGYSTREKVLLFSSDTDINFQMKQRVKKYVKGERTIKPLPIGINFASTMWIVGEYVMIIKSKKKPHTAMVFRDHDLADNLCSISMFLWKSA